MHKNKFLAIIAVALLSACQTAPADTKSGGDFVDIPPSSTCFETAMNDTYLNMCLKDLLEQADQRLNAVSAELHAKAENHDEEFEKRAAIKDLSNSNLAFSSYRDAECTRRAMLGESRQVKEDVLMGCKVDLTRQRIRSFFDFN